MKRTGFGILTVIFLFACNHKNIPDVSDISVNLQVQHFEQDFFAMDTVNIFPSLQKLDAKYPYFLGDYVENILGLPAITDTSVQALTALKQFIREYHPIKDSVDKKYSGFNNVDQQVKQGLQFVKYYFPAYKPPVKLITYIGPMEGYSEVLTRDALAVGLQLHLGKDFFLYKTEIGQETYPSYISRRFTPEYIAANCMKNIINDIEPEKLTGKTLIEQMIEKGKRLYVLDKILPYTPDTIKTGYTENQLKGCYNNEGNIWNFFLTNSLLDSKDPDIIKDYMDESPNTPAIGENSPGFIGLFVGWQIVKSYMSKNPSFTLTDLLHTDDRKIFEETRYHPK